MNKLLNIIRHILLILLLVFIGLFIYKYYLDVSLNQTGIVFTFEIILTYFLLFIFYLSCILDIFVKKYKVKDMNRYNKVIIIGIIPILIIFGRMLFDSTIISNLKPIDIINKYFLIGTGYSFFEHNIYVIIILIILMLTYKFINLRKSTRK